MFKVRDGVCSNRAVRPAWCMVLIASPGRCPKRGLAVECPRRGPPIAYAFLLMPRKGVESTEGTKKKATDDRNLSTDDDGLVLLILGLQPAYFGMI